VSREITLLPSEGELDVDLAAEAFVPLVLEIVRRQQAARPQLHIVYPEKDSDAPLRPVPAIL
jgi:hypothetical protein